MGIINENENEKKNENNNFEKEFIPKNIDLKLLSQEDQNIINNIPHTDFTYICIYCHKIPQLDIKYDKDEGHIKSLCLQECGNKIKLDNSKSNDPLELKLDINNNFGLKKISLETLYKENYMNINNNIILKNENKLPFETINELHEYLKVYKSYLNLREEMKKYNFGETKNNELFSLFEDLLYIGLYGFGTYNEYKNSILIKEFLLEKFKIFNKIQVLTNGLKLYRFNYVTFKKTANVIPLKDNIIALKYHNKDYNNKFCVLKFELNNNNSFDSNIYQKYFIFDSYKDIPLELRKNFILCNESLEFDKIFYFGKNEYLVQPENQKILYKFYFDENINEYLYKKFNINIEGDISNIFVLDNNDIVVITFSHVYIFTIDYGSNLLFCIKQFLDLNYPYQRPTLLKMKNGNFIINFPKKLVYFSKSYEIITIFKIIYIKTQFKTQFYDMIKLNNENIIFGNMGKSYHLNVKTFDFSFFEISEYASFGINDNILGKANSDSFSLFDYKLNKSIYIENFGDPYYWMNSRFILLDRSKNIFGFISNNYSNTFMKIYQIKN